MFRRRSNRFAATKHAIRYLWSDKSPEVSINNDIPSEIRIHPNYRGGWVLA